MATKLATSDDHLLVRVRASEFLGLAELADPRPNILECLSLSRSGVELGLMLNSVVLLRDSQPGYAFQLDVANLSPEALGDDIVKRRLEYLTGLTTEKPPKVKKTKKK